MDSGTLITLVTIVISAVAIVLGTIIPAWVEGRAVLKALDLAMIETMAIYCLVVALLLLFANPFVQ